VSEPDWIETVPGCRVTQAECPWREPEYAVSESDWIKTVPGCRVTHAECHRRKPE
jgi:hypothetical protein